MGLLQPGRRPAQIHDPKRTVTERSSSFPKAGFGPPFLLPLSPPSTYSPRVLPIVQRELQTAARNRRLYLWRSLSGLAVLLIVPLIVLNAPVARRWTGLFTALVNIALFLCLVEGIRKTSDSISSERRQGTLGLLFLSTLTGGDIIFGKLASATIRSLSTLLVFIPLLSITLLVGGTTGGEFWRGIFVLILALVMSLS